MESLRRNSSSGLLGNGEDEGRVPSWEFGEREEMEMEVGGFSLRSMRM